MKPTTQLILDMAYAFRDANAWVRRERVRELRQRGRKRYVRYLQSLANWSQR